MKNSVDNEKVDNGNTQAGVKKKKSVWERFIGLFYKNSFLLIISLILAIIVWFLVMASRVVEDASTVIHDVPIVISMSEQAQSDGIKVYSQTHATADVSVKGNTLITNKLTANDFEVVASFSPSSTKVSGTSINVATLELRAKKKTELVDYEITSVSPSEITIEYDKSKEITLPIESGISYSSASGYYTEAPVLSEESVTISGPESSINKISRVAAVYEIADQVKEEKRFTCELTLYGQDDKPINDYSSLHISLSTNTVDVEIPVYSKKTVKLAVNAINMPKGFAESNIKVTPETIDIVGSASVLANIETITLDTPVNFNEVNLSNTAFEMDIPIPSGARSISTESGDKAKVEINLSGYKEVRFTTTNINAVNEPSGKSHKIMTTSIQVTVIGSEAQIAKLTGENIYLTVDLSAKADSTGTFEVPATVAVNANSCWAYGKYSVNVSIEEVTVAASKMLLQSSEKYEDGATPTE